MQVVHGGAKYQFQIECKCQYDIYIQMIIQIKVSSFLIVLYFSHSLSEDLLVSEVHGVDGHSPLMERATAAAKATLVSCTRFRGFLLFSTLDPERVRSRVMVGRKELFRTRYGELVVESIAELSAEDKDSIGED
ncbi:hypothetical protein QQP08_024876 [Theobroma cacao]|nr:hypothetical protein QQP08_024876 [Theobroma cacao]